MSKNILGWTVQYYARRVGPLYLYSNFYDIKTAKVTVEDNIVRVEREDGQIAVFEGNKDNYCIEYNTGFLGGGIYRDILTDTTPYIFKKHIYALHSPYQNT